MNLPRGVKLKKTLATQLMEHLQKFTCRNISNQSKKRLA